MSNHEQSPACRPSRLRIALLLVLAYTAGAALDYTLNLDNPLLPSRAEQQDAQDLARWLGPSS